MMRISMIYTLGKSEHVEDERSERRIKEPKRLFKIGALFTIQVGRITMKNTRIARRRLGK
jgi:hypothetical protein